MGLRQGLGRGWVPRGKSKEHPRKLKKTYTGENQGSSPQTDVRTCSRKTMIPPPFCFSSWLGPSPNLIDPVYNHATMFCKRPQRTFIAPYHWRKNKFKTGLGCWLRVCVVDAYFRHPKLLVETLVGIIIITICNNDLMAGMSAHGDYNACWHSSSSASFTGSLMTLRDSWELSLLWRTRPPNFSCIASGHCVFQKTS